MVHVQSGVEMGVTLGTPIGLLVKNEDQRPHDYTETDLYPRPSHADYTYLEKYGIKASSGGGRSSARETIGPEYFPQKLHIFTVAMYRSRRCRCHR
jgi:chorismate synthase